MPINTLSPKDRNNFLRTKHIPLINALDKYEWNEKDRGNSDKFDEIVENDTNVSKYYDKDLWRTNTGQNGKTYGEYIADLLIAKNNLKKNIQYDLTNKGNLLGKNFYETNEFYKKNKKSYIQNSHDFLFKEPFDANYVPDDKKKDKQDKIVKKYNEYAKGYESGLDKIKKASDETIRYYKENNLSPKDMYNDWREYVKDNSKVGITDKKAYNEWRKKVKTNKPKMSESWDEFDNTVKNTVEDINKETSTKFDLKQKAIEKVTGSIKEITRNQVYKGLTAEELSHVPVQHKKNVDVLSAINNNILAINNELKKRAIKSEPIVPGEQIASYGTDIPTQYAERLKEGIKFANELIGRIDTPQIPDPVYGYTFQAGKFNDDPELSNIHQIQKQIAKMYIDTSESILKNRRQEGMKYVLDRAAFVPEEKVTTGEIIYAKPDSYLSAISDAKRQYGEILIGMGIVNRNDLKAINNMTPAEIERYYPLYNWMMNTGTPSDDIWGNLWKTITNPGRAVSPGMSQFYHDTFGVKDISNEMVELKEHFIKVNRSLYERYFDSQTTGSRNINPEYGFNDYLKGIFRAIDPIDNWIMPFVQGTSGSNVNPLYKPDDKYNILWTKEFMENPMNSVLENSIVLENARNISTFQFDNGLMNEADYKYIMSKSDSEKAMGVTTVVSNLLADMSYGPFKLGSKIANQMSKGLGTALSVSNNIKNRMKIISDIGKYSTSEEFTSIPYFQRLQGISSQIFRNSSITQSQAKALSVFNELSHIPIGMVTSYMLEGDPYMSPESILETAKNGLILSGANMFFGRIFANLAKDYTIKSKVFKEMASSKQAPFLERRMNTAYYISNTFAQAAATPLQRITSGTPVNLDFEFLQDMIVNTVLLGKDTKRVLDNTRMNYNIKQSTLDKPMITKFIPFEEIPKAANRIDEVISTTDKGITAKVETSLLENVANKIGKDVNDITASDLINNKQIVKRRNKKQLRNIEKVNEYVKLNNDEIKIVEKEIDEPSIGKFIPELNTVVVNSNAVDALNDAGIEYNAIDAVNDVIEHEFIHKPVTDLLNTDNQQSREIKTLYDKVINSYREDPDAFEKRLIDNGLHEWFFDLNNFGDLDLETFDVKIKEDQNALNEFAVYMLSDSDIGKRFRNFVSPIYGNNTLYSNWISPIINSFKNKFADNNIIGNDLLSIRLNEITPKIATELPQVDSEPLFMTYKAMLASKMFQSVPNEEKFNDIQSAYRDYQAKALEYGRSDIANTNIKSFYDNLKSVMANKGITDENRIIDIMPNYIRNSAKNISKYTLTEEFARDEATRIVENVEKDNQTPVFDIEKNTDKDIDTRIKLNMMSTQLGYRNTKDMMNDIRIKNIDAKGKVQYFMLPIRQITGKLYDRVRNNEMYKNMSDDAMKLGVTVQALKLKTYKQLPIYRSKVNISADGNVTVKNERNFGTKTIDMRNIDIWDSNYDAVKAIHDNFWVDKIDDPIVNKRDKYLHDIFMNMELIKIPDMEVSIEKLSKNGYPYTRVDKNKNKLDERTLPIVADAFMEQDIFVLPKENGSLALKINSKNLDKWNIHKKPENARRFYKYTVDYSFWRWINSDHTWGGDDIGKKMNFMRKYMSQDFIMDKLSKGKYELSFEDMAEMLTGKVDDVNKKANEYVNLANLIMEKAKVFYHDGLKPLTASDLWDKEITTKNEAGYFIYEGINNLHNWNLSHAGTNRTYDVKGNIIKKQKYMEKYLPLLYANQPMKFTNPDDLTFFLYSAGFLDIDSYRKKDYEKVFNELQITKKDDGHYYQKYAIWNDNYFKDYLDNRIIKEQMQTLNSKVGGDGAELIVSDKQHKFINSIYGRTDNAIYLGKPKGYWKDNLGNVIMYKGATHYHNIDETSENIAVTNPGFLHFRKFKNQVPSIISSSALKNAEAFTTVIKDVPDLGFKVGMNNKGDVLFTLQNGKKDFSQESIKVVHDYIVSNWLNGKIVDIITGEKPMTGDYSISYDVPKKPVDRISNAQIALDKMPQTYMWDAFLEANETGKNFVEALNEINENLVNDHINQKARAYIYVWDAILSNYKNKSNVPNELHNQALSIVAEDIYNTIDNMDIDMFKNYAGDNNADKKTILSILDIMRESDNPIIELPNLMMAMPRFISTENNVIQSRISDHVKSALNTSITGTQLALQVEGASAYQVKKSPEVLIANMKQRNNESTEDFNNRKNRSAAFLASRQYQIEKEHIDPETGKYKADSNAFTVPMDWLMLENKRRIKEGYNPITIGDRILIGRVPSDSPDCVTAGIIGAVSNDNACVTGNPDFWVKHWGADMDKDGVTIRTADKYMTEDLFNTLYDYLLNSGSQFAAFRQDRENKSVKQITWNSKTENGYETKNPVYWNMLPHVLGYKDNLLDRYGTQGDYIAHANAQAVQLNRKLPEGIKFDINNVADISIKKQSAVDYFNDYPFNLKGLSKTNQPLDQYTNIKDYSYELNKYDEKYNTPIDNTLRTLKNILKDTALPMTEPGVDISKAIQYVTDTELRKTLIEKGIELAPQFKDIPGLKNDISDIMQLVSILKYTTAYKMNPFISFYTKDREFTANDLKFAGMIINTIDGIVPYDEPELGKNNIFDLKSGIQITNGILQYYDARSGTITRSIPIGDVFDEYGNVKTQYNADETINTSRQFTADEIARIIKINIGNSTKNIFDIYNWKGFEFKDFEKANELTARMAYSLIDKYLPDETIENKGKFLTYMAYGIPSKSAMMGGWSKGSLLSPRWSKIKGSPDKTKNDIYDQEFRKMVDMKSIDLNVLSKNAIDYIRNNYYDISTSPVQMINMLKDKGITPLDADGNDLSTHVYNINRDNFTDNQNIIKEILGGIPTNETKPYNKTKEYNMSLTSFISNKFKSPLNDKTFNAISSMNKIRKQIQEKYPGFINDKTKKFKSISELDNAQWQDVYENIIKPELSNKIDILFNSKKINESIKNQLLKDIEEAIGSTTEPDYYNINEIENYFANNTLSSDLSRKFTKGLAVFNVLDALNKIHKSGKYGEYTNVSLVNPINKRDILSRVSSNYRMIPAQDIITNDYVVTNGNISIMPKIGYEGNEYEINKIPIRAYDISYDIQTEMPDAVVAMPEAYHDHILHHDIFLRTKDVIMDNAYRRYNELILNNENIKLLSDIENGDYDTINDIVDVETSLSQTFSDESFSIRNIPENFQNMISKSNYVNLPDLINSAYPLWLEYNVSMASVENKDIVRSLYTETDTNKNYIKQIKDNLATAMKMKLLSLEWANAFRKLELQTKEYIIANKYENEDTGLLNSVIDRFKRTADKLVDMKPSDFAKEFRIFDPVKMEDVLTELVGIETVKDSFTGEEFVQPIGIYAKEQKGEAERKEHAQKTMNNRMVEPTDKRLMEEDAKLGTMIPGYYNVLAFMKNKSREKAVKGEAYQLTESEMNQAYFLLKKANQKTIDELNQKRSELNYKPFEYTDEKNMREAVREIANHIELVNSRTGIMYNAFQKMGLPGFDKDWVTLSDMEKYEKGSLARNIGMKKIEDFVIKNRMLQGDINVKGLRENVTENLINVKGKQYTFQDYSEMVSIFDILKAVVPDKFNDMVNYDYHMMTSRHEQMLNDNFSVIESYMRERYLKNPDNNGVAHNLIMGELNTISSNRSILDKQIDIEGISNELNKNKYLASDNIGLFTSVSYDDNQFNYVDLYSIVNDNEAKNINPGQHVSSYSNAQGVIVGFAKGDKDKYAVIMDPDVNENNLYVIPLNKIKSMYAGYPYEKDKIGKSIHNRMRKLVKENSDYICNFISDNLEKITVKKEDYKRREVETVAGKIPTYRYNSFVIGKDVIQDNIKLSSTLRQIKSPIIDSRLRALSNILQNIQTSGFYLPTRHFANAGLGITSMLIGAVTGNPLMTVSGLNVALASGAKGISRWFKSWMGNAMMTASNVIRHPLDKSVLTDKINPDTGELIGHNKRIGKTIYNNTIRPLVEIFQLLSTEKEYEKRIKKIGTDVTHGITLHSEFSGLQTEIANIMDNYNNKDPQKDIRKDGRWSKHEYTDGQMAKMWKSYKAIDHLRLIQNKIDKTAAEFTPKWDNWSREEIKNLTGKCLDVVETALGSIPLIGKSTKSNIKISPGKNFWLDALNTVGSLYGNMQKNEAISANKSQILIENYLQSNTDYIRLFMERSGYKVPFDLSPYMMYNRRMNQMWKSIGNYVKTVGNSTSLGKQLTMLARFSHNNIMDQTTFLNTRKKLWTVLKEEIKNDKALQKALDVTGIPYGDNILEDWKKELGRGTARATTFGLILGSLSTLVFNQFESDDDEYMPMIKKSTPNSLSQLLVNVLDIPYGYYSDITNTFIELGNLIIEDKERSKKASINRLTQDVSGLMPFGVLETEMLGIAIPNIILEIKKNIDYIRNVNSNKTKENEEMQDEMILYSILKQVQGMPGVDIANEYIELQKRLNKKRKRSF